VPASENAGQHWFCEGEIVNIYEHLSREFSKKIEAIVSARRCDVESEKGGDEVEGHFCGKEVEKRLMETVFNNRADLLNMNIRIDAKALEILGDESLEEKSRLAVSANAKITPKVLGRLGEAFILPTKVQKTLGTEEMSREQRLAMIKEEEKNARALAEEKRLELERILAMNPKNAPELKALRCSQKVSAKAFSNLGGEADDDLLQEVRNHLSKDMTISKKTLAMTGDDQIVP